MFSPDEAYGLIGQIEAVRQGLARGQSTLAAHAVGASINSQDLNAFANAVQAAPALMLRLQLELVDPNSAFGT